MSIDIEEILKAAEKRFGRLFEPLLSELRRLKDDDDLQILSDGLKDCASLEDLERMVHWLDGRQNGRIDGMRRAIDAVLGVRGDDMAEDISDQAFETCDLEELERLLLLASRGQISRN